jgi:exo-beta-1,3-glucanase (GH17 family)
MTRLPLLFAFTAASVWLAWSLLGAPIALPPSPLGPGEKLPCVSYTPYQGSQTPFDKPLVISDQQITADMERLAKITSCIRTYSAEATQRRVTRIAASHGLKVMQGIWLSRNLATNRREIESAIQLARLNPGKIEAIIVGNEVSLRGELPPAKLAEYLQEVKRRTGLAVTYADVWEFWLRLPELVPYVDFVTIHILPYWEDIPVAAKDAANHVRDIRAEVSKRFEGKEILIGEVGWPSQGRMREGALPSPSNQARVLSDVIAAAKEGNWKVNYIEAFDQPWKRLLEGTVGGYWGLLDAHAREPKFHFGEPISNYPHWRLQAGLGIGAALIVFVSAWLGGPRTSQRDWKTDLAITLTALVTGLLFGLAVENLAIDSEQLGDRIKAISMVGLAFAVPAAAAFAVARGTELPGFAVALNRSYAQRLDWPAWIVAILFAASIAAAIHVALELVMDSRYQDFPFAALSPIAISLAIVAFAGKARSRPGLAELVACVVLFGAALFIIANEGLRNWQALWLASTLILLSLACLRARAGPG